MTAARPSRTSSPSRLSSFSFSRPLSRAYLLSVARQRRVEAGEVRAALVRVDVVGEREDRLDVLGVPLHRDLDVALVVLALEVDDVLVDRVLGLVHVRDEVADPALVVELDRSPPARSSVSVIRRPRVRNAVSRRRCDSVSVDHSISSKISASGRNEIVVPVSCRDADRLHVGVRHAARELLAVDLPVAVHLGDEPLGERVDDGDADAVEAAGDLVAAPAELAAGVQLRQHDRQRRAGPARS